jgi:hypothetical protein
MLFRQAVLIICLVFVPTIAAADCVYNGRQYPEGTRIGLLVCENGQWIAKR